MFRARVAVPDTCAHVARQTCSPGLDAVTAAGTQSGASPGWSALREEEKEKSREDAMLRSLWNSWEWSPQKSETKT